MKSFIVVAALLLLNSFGSCLEVTVTPEVVNPGTTPSFAVNCGLVEFEEVQVVNLSISRQTFNWAETTTGANTNNNPSELIASLNYMSPNIPQVAAAFQRLTVLGQITTMESELGTYLNIAWPSPSLTDLGIYTCTATFIGETGLLETLVAQAQVTTANPTLDRVLLAVSNIQTQVDGLNTSLVDLVARADNLSAIVQDPLSVDSVAESSGDVDIPASVSVVDSLRDSIAALEQRIRDLEVSGAQTENANATDDFPTDGDQIQNFFTVANSTYFLVKGHPSKDANWAEGSCKSKGLTLASVDNDQSFKDITAGLESVIDKRTLVVVAGQREPGPGSWIYSNTGAVMNYFSWGPGQPANTRDCIILRKTGGASGDVVAMATLPCSQSRSDLYYLCVTGQ